jgi:hypothetical protein
MDKEHSGPIVVSLKEFKPRSVKIDGHILRMKDCPIISVFISNLGQYYF